MRPGPVNPIPPTPAERALCVFNGIDGATGRYLHPPLSLRQVADLARSEPRYPPPRPHRREPRGVQEKGPGHGIDDRDLGQTGWGVVFSPSAGPAVRKALAPLLAHRRRQAGRERKRRYREMTYRKGESKTGFLIRCGAAPGPVDPDRMPYYLLLVGDPEEIPFEFQYQLDVQHAVGRIHFDTAREYRCYARTVVAAETGAVRRPPAAAFFAPSNPRDVLTRMSAEDLASPLAQEVAGRLDGWSVARAFGRAATKARLCSLLADEAPALLFTAGHGLCFTPDDPRQLALQGALVCQDWRGPGRPVTVDQCFGAGDVPEDARIAGLIAFHFSCYGAGTPRHDNFLAPLDGRAPVAPRAFVSRLAQRLLAHPRGGALAVVGHVDRAWSWSFQGLERNGRAFRAVFESSLRRLADGYPIGSAMEYFNACHAELAVDLGVEVGRHDAGRDRRLAELWTHRNDARNYAVLGDPAVRLAVAGKEER